MFWKLPTTSINMKDFDIFIYIHFNQLFKHFELSQNLTFELKKISPSFCYNCE